VTQKPWRAPLAKNRKAYVVIDDDAHRIYFEERVLRTDEALDQGARVVEIDLGDGPFAQILMTIMEADRGGEALAEDVRKVVDALFGAGRSLEK